MSNSSSLLENPLDTTRVDSTQTEALLEGIQGNILKFHARLHAEVLFVSFTTTDDKPHKGIVELAKEVTSALDQRNRTRQWKEARKTQADRGGGVPDSGPFRMMALSWRGYEHLGLADLAPESVEDRKPNKPADKKKSYFSSGMQQPYVSQYGEFWDPHIDHWEGAYKDPALPIHLMILLADDNESRLKNHVAEVRKTVDTFGLVIAQETLVRKIHEDVDRDRPIEHFGFRDGISQPMFLIEEEDKTGAQVIDKDPGEPLYKVLVPEPDFDSRQQPAAQTASASKKTFGSFLVVLKLEQNVRKFLEQTRRLADRLRISHEQAQELCVGRRKTGKPLISHVDVSAQYGENPGSLEPVLTTSENDFNFNEDGQGLRCPFHAHIRKVNPRYDSELQFRPVLARRGMPYGPDRKDLGSSAVGSAPSEGVGLMFMSFQSEICDFVKAISRAQEPDPYVGIDPILGRVPKRPGIRDEYDQKWVTLEWDGSRGGPANRTATFKEEKFRVSDVVTTKGGEYFFAPSVTFLRSLDRLWTPKNPSTSEQPSLSGIESPQSAQQPGRPPRRRGSQRGRL